MTGVQTCALPISPTGTHGIDGYAGRWPRLFGIWIDPQVGALLYAPVLALAGTTVWHAVRRHRERLTRAFPQAGDAEAATLLLGLVGVAGILSAVLVAPSFAGRSPGEPLVVVLPVLAALVGASLLRWPRLGGALALAGVVLTVWLLVASWVSGEVQVSPIGGPVPWSVVAGDAPGRIR